MAFDPESPYTERMNEREWRLLCKHVFAIYSDFLQILYHFHTLTERSWLKYFTSLLAHMKQVEYVLLA